MHYTFPLGDDANWQESITCSVTALAWLQDNASLTAKLKALNSDFGLTLLGQGWQTNNLGDSYLAREVLLKCAGQPLVYAHTNIPKSSLIGKNQFLSQLENKPLGEAIFQQQDLQRSLIEYAQFSHKNKIWLMAQKWNYSHQIPEYLYGRRSTFLVNKLPIYVSEIFLPSSPLYL